MNTPGRRLCELAPKLSRHRGTGWIPDYAPEGRLQDTECRQSDRWSIEGSRVYATAIDALTREVYYRYANGFNPKK